MHHSCSIQELCASAGLPVKVSQLQPLNRPPSLERKVKKSLALLMTASAFDALQTILICYMINHVFYALSMFNILPRIDREAKSDFTSMDFAIAVYMNNLMLKYTNLTLNRL